MVVEQSQNDSGPPSPSSGKAPHLPWFRGHCPSHSLSFQGSYPPVWVLGWARRAWVSCGSKGEGASHQAVAGTWLECVMNPQVLRPLPALVGLSSTASYVLGECSESRSTSKCVHRPTHKIPSLKIRQVSVARQCPPCFRVFFPANSTPSLTHRGHPRRPQNWRGGAPSKREGRCSGAGVLSR